MVLNCEDKMDSDVKRISENFLGEYGFFEDFKTAYEKCDLEKLWNAVDEMKDNLTELKKEIDRAMLE